MKLKKTKWIIAPAVVVVVAGGFLVRGQFGKTEEVTIKTAKAERGTVTSTVSATGTLQPLTTVDVKSNVGGRVDKLVVDEGDTVKAGQLLAVVDPTDTTTAFNQASADMQAARAKVDQAIASLALQKVQTSVGIENAAQALEAAKLRLAQAEEQAKVQPTLTRAAIDQANANYLSAQATLKQLQKAGGPQRTSQSQSSYDQAVASFSNAEKTYKRQKELLAKGFVAQGTVDSAEAQFEAAKATLASAQRKQDTLQEELDADNRAAEARVAQCKAALENAKADKIQDKLKVQELATARATVRQAEAALASAKANALQTRMRSGDIINAKAQVERNRAQYDSAKIQLGYTNITAPREGVVMKKYVEVGSIINSGRSSFAGTGAGTSVVQLADTSRMFALVNVDETDVAQIEVGQKVDIIVDAFSSEPFEGKVTKVSPQATIDQNVTYIPVTVEVDSPDARLKPGMNVTCDFVVDRKENVLLVPNEAIKESDSDTIVTVMQGDKQITRKIKVGIIGNESTEVVSGLKDGDVVVTAIIEPAKALTQPGGSNRPPTGGIGGGGMGGGGGGRGMRGF